MDGGDEDWGVGVCGPWLFLARDDPRLSFEQGRSSQNCGVTNALRRESRIGMRGGREGTVASMSSTSQDAIDEGDPSVVHLSARSTVYRDRNPTFIH